MNIALVPTNYKAGERSSHPLSMAELALLKREGVISKKMRVYWLEVNHLDVQVECPVIVDEDKRPVCVIMPAFKLPYRRYPGYVYLYALGILNTSSIILGYTWGVYQHKGTVPLCPLVSA